MNVKVDGNRIDHYFPLLKLGIEHQYAYFSLGKDKLIRLVFSK